MANENAVIFSSHHLFKCKLLQNLDISLFND